jgi:hypothetical protein
VSRAFTKLFASITESTIWIAPDAHLRLWVYLLANADQNGNVWGSIPGIASHARVPLADTEAAIKSFMSPDPYSRTKDEEGRRLREIDGGWQLVNHAKYRVLMNAEDTKERKRKWDQENRQRPTKSDTSRLNPTNPTQAEAEGKSRQAEPDGSLDPIWKDGLSVLQGQGLSEQNARTFLGMLLKDYAKVDVTEAITAAIGQANAKGYILGVLKNRQKKTEPQNLRVAL